MTVAQMVVTGKSRGATKSNGNGVKAGKIPDLDNEVSRDDRLV